MTRTSIKRAAAVGLVTGFAGLTFAAPAVAMQPKDPGLGRVDTGTTASTTSTDDPWMEIAIGALGGLALAGAGVAAASTVRQRHAVSAP